MGRRIAHIHEVPAPVVGERYRVPAVFQRFRKTLTLWVPVIGPEHEDREHIGFEHDHWHIDWRFAGNSLIEYHAFSLPPRHWHGKVLCRNDWTLHVGNRVFTCRRHMEPFPVPYWRQALQAAYAEHRVNPKCAVCPHRGFPLAGSPTEEIAGRTAWVCPGHGLAWDIETGQLLERRAEERHG